jgi:AcrR family transcriptional regulator
MELILRTTAEVLAERGYHNASIEQVAERLDLAKASIYYYVSSKDELVLACLMTCADRVRDALLAVSAGEGTPIVRLRRLIERQAELITVEYPEMARLFLHPLDWPPAIAAAMADRQREHDLLFREVIDAAARAGEIDPTNTTVARLFLHGALNTVPAWSRGALDPAALQQVVDTAMRLFAPRDASLARTGAGSKKASATRRRT